MSDTLHNAFKIEGNGLLNVLITPVVIYPELQIREDRLHDILSDPIKAGFQFNALWDTGATCSCIKPEIAKKLGITNNIITHTRVTGVNSTTQVKPVYKIGGLILPNRIIKPGFHLIESDIASTADILIGMDLILQGDFTISNYGGKTVFCFSMPPHKNTIDLVERSNKVNEKLSKKKK